MQKHFFFLLKMSTTSQISNTEFASICFFSFINVKLPFWYWALADIEWWITRWPRRLEVNGSSPLANYFLHPISTCSIRYRSTGTRVPEWISREIHADFKCPTRKIYCTSGREKITYIVTLSFRWIILFSMSTISFQTGAKCAILLERTVVFAVPQHRHNHLQIGSMSGANSWYIKGAFF